MRLADALKGWHDFYLLVGTAGATLLALLFVAVSLGIGFLTEERQGATRRAVQRSLHELDRLQCSDAADSEAISCVGDILGTIEAQNVGRE